MTLLEKLNELLSNQASAEDIQSALGEYMIPKGTFNKVNEENKTLKLKIEELNGNVSTLSGELETLKTANMNEQELLQHKLEQYENQIREHAIEKNRLSAENKFVSAGFEKEQYLPLLQQLVSEDAEKTLSLVDGFLALTNAKVEESKKAQLDDLLDKGTELPKGDSNNGEGEITLEQFRNFTASERTALYNDNNELYQELSNAEKNIR